LATNTQNANESLLGAILRAAVGLYNRRWLAIYFVQRQLSQSTKGSFLGFSWLILTPLIMILLYTLIFSEIIGLRFREVDSVGNYGLYLYCGLIPFMAFGDALNQSVASIKTNATLVQKVVFPLEVLPFSTAMTAFITQFFGLAALSVITLVIEGTLRWTMVLLPLIMVPQLLFILGLAYFMSVVGTYMPDFRETLRAIVRAAFFFTPIIWPAELAYERGLGFVVDYNPLAFIVEAYRNFMLDGVIPDVMPFVYFSLFAGALFLAGFLLFVRTKRQFADVL
jgi:ABC-2 type transport system permease protein